MTAVFALQPIPNRGARTRGDLFSVAFTRIVQILTFDMSHPAHPDLASWLTSLGLAQYTQLFVDNDVDAALLPQLTADDLRDMGIT